MPPRAHAVAANSVEQPSTCRRAGRRWDVVGEDNGERCQHCAAADQRGCPDPPPITRADRIDEPTGEMDRDPQWHQSIEHHQQATHFKGMIPQRPTAHRVQQPIEARQEYRQQWRFAGVETQFATGIGMDDGIDGIPARLSNESIDRKRALLNERTNRQPPAAIVGR